MDFRDFNSRCRHADSEVQQGELDYTAPGPIPMRLGIHQRDGQRSKHGIQEDGGILLRRVPPKILGCGQSWHDP